jgi:hypothetical protein
MFHRDIQAEWPARYRSTGSGFAGHVAIDFTALSNI